ncbi:MAG: hypothetical protein KKD18_00190 [Nanoarchaeota archaeon]|nr:hypothetical protein [Nanoarchaeota archaeon]MBU0976817.1 hypothetical protein [Nanoarchaeota archaeon]
MKKRGENALLILVLVFITLLVGVLFFNSGFFLNLSPELAGKIKETVSLRQEETCEESWQCSEWGDCVDGVQMRSCEDMNGCEIENEMPVKERGCGEEMPLQRDEALRARINDAQKAIIESDGHDYSKLYAILELQKNDLPGVYNICKDFNPIFCLREASVQNPELRNEICAELERRIKAEYGGRVDVEGHKKECLSGIPKYVY